MNEFEIGDKVRLSNSMLGLDEGRIPIPVPEGVTGVVVDKGPGPCAMCYEELKGDCP